MDDGGDLVVPAECVAWCREQDYAVLIDHGGPGADALVRWLVTGEHVVGNGVSTVDRGWPLPATPDSWV